MKKKILLIALTLFIIVGYFSSVAYADLKVTHGKPIAVFADPSDFVVELDTKGSCGSGYFHIQRTSIIFKELTAVALTAFSSGNRLLLFTASCSGDRNILSHGGATNN